MRDWATNKQPVRTYLKEFHPKLVQNVGGDQVASVFRNHTHEKDAVAPQHAIDELVDSLNACAIARVLV